ncbi:CD0519/CD1768 family membrane protein [Clostridioides difficile]
MEKLSDKKRVKAVSMETFVFILLLAVGFGYVGSIMGAGMMFKVIMSTAHALLLDTVFLIMAMAVLAGALSALLSEFGVISLVNKIFKGLMRPIWGLPGASIAGVVATYLSDNPAIIPFAKDKTFTQYFKKYQIPALCNLGTAFGMGLIVTTFMIAQGKEYVLPAIIGNVGAIIGSIISVRIMLTFTKKYYNYDPKSDNDKQVSDKHAKVEEFREIREGNVFQRGLDAILEGGKLGVEMGMAIIPGVLVVCTLVMLLTFGPSTDPATGQAVYTGAAYEGIKLLPAIGDKISFIIEPLFGFTSPEAIAFPVTALGAVGAAISLVPEFIKSGAITPNDIAVFTAMGMCWSGYLSTHIGMMDALDARPLAGKAILSHTIGGLCAGVCAHFIFMLVG